MKLIRDLIDSFLKLIDRMTSDENENMNAGKKWGNLKGLIRSLKFDEYGNPIYSRE